ncbi:hypothetical protein AURANDRAFT_68728, partial [Aureococcus anophagefferens]
AARVIPTNKSANPSTNKAKKGEKLEFPSWDTLDVMSSGTSSTADTFRLDGLASHHHPGVASRQQLEEEAYSYGIAPGSHRHLARYQVLEPTLAVTESILREKGGDCSTPMKSCCISNGQSPPKYTLWKLEHQLSGVLRTMPFRAVDGHNQSLVNTSRHNTSCTFIQKLTHGATIRWIRGWPSGSIVLARLRPRAVFNANLRGRTVAEKIYSTAFRIKKKIVPGTSPYGKVVRSAELKCLLLTGEFVYTGKAKGKSFLSRIVDVRQHAQLPQDEREKFAQDGHTGVDQQTWAMIETGFSGGGIRHFSAPRSQNCYLSDTYRPALHRVASKSTFSAIKVDRAPGFKHVSLFLGNYWNVFCSQTLQRQAASMSEQSHPYAPLECVRAIVEMVSAVGDADEEHLQALALELGLEPVKAKSCRRPKLPSLCLKYDADARILSLATHWVDLPFEQLQSLVKSSAVGSRRTPPASPSGNKHQPKKAKPSSVDVLYSPTKTVAEFWAPVMPPPDLPRAARRAKLAKAKVAS